MTRKPRILNGERIVSSINSAGKTGYSHANEQNSTLAPNKLTHNVSYL